METLGFPKHDGKPDGGLLVNRLHENTGWKNRRCWTENEDRLCRSDRQKKKPVLLAKRKCFLSVVSDCSSKPFQMAVRHHWITLFVSGQTTLPV